MTYEDAVRRLANHANEPFDGLASEEESYVFTLWRMSKDKLPLDFVSKANDVIECLEVVNVRLNGCVPSEVPASAGSPMDRALEGIINSLILRGVEHALSWQQEKLFGEEIARQALLCSWKIGKAWEAILAGDIDNLKNYLNNELLVRAW